MEKELSGPSFGRLCFISVKSDAYMTYRSVCKLDFKFIARRTNQA